MRVETNGCSTQDPMTLVSLLDPSVAQVLSLQFYIYNNPFVKSSFRSFPFAS